MRQGKAKMKLGDEDGAAAVEFALEGLYLMRRLSKDVTDGGAVYRT